MAVAMETTTSAPSDTVVVVVTPTTGTTGLGSKSESSLTTPTLEVLVNMDSEHGGGDTGGEPTNSGTGSVASKDAIHENTLSLQSKGQESKKETESPSGAQETCMQTKRDMQGEEQCVTSQDMDTDTTGSEDPYCGPLLPQPEDPYCGPLLPQPEAFQGRSTKTGYVYDVRMK